MLCDNCHERPASIHLYTNVNGQDREISLCQQCYQELKNQQGNQGKMNNNEFIKSQELEYEFFSSLKI